MEILEILLISLSLTVVSDCYICAKDGISYHTEVTTGCQVYHLCENGVMTTLNCPDGQAYDYHSSECKDSSLVYCDETEHQRPKISQPEEMIPSNSTEKLKKEIKELSQYIEKIAEENVKKVTPTVYDQLKADYSSFINITKKDLKIILKEKILPRIEKFYNHFKVLIEKVTKKIQRSLEMSDGKYINLGAFYNIAGEVPTEMKPLLNLGNYLSTELVYSSKTKRSTEGKFHLRELPEILESYINPLITRLISLARELFHDTESTLTSKVILPVLFDMLEDKETRYNLHHIYVITRDTVAPIISEIRSSQTYQTTLGTIVRIPQSKIEKVLEQIKEETAPFIRKVVEKHLSNVLIRLSDNVLLMFESIDRLMSASEGHIRNLKDNIQRFIAKQRAVIRTSNSTYFHVFTLEEIAEDLKPIKITLVKIFIDYLSKINSSWSNILFSKNSVLYNAIIKQDNLSTLNFLIPI